jgi:hypothetical protein
MSLTSDMCPSDMSDMQPANAAMMMTIQTILFMTYSHTFICQLS